MDSMEDKNEVTDLEEKTSQRKNQLVVEYSENHSRNESSINAALKTVCSSSENNEVTDKKSNAKTMQFYTKHTENKDAGNLKAISMKKPMKSMFTIPSRNKVIISATESIESCAQGKVLSLPATNNNILESIMSNTVEDSMYKMVVDPQLKVLKEEFTTLLKQAVIKEDTIISLEKRLADSEKCRIEIQKKCSNLENANEKLKKSLSDTTEKCYSIQQELNAANSLIEDTKKTKKAMVAAKSDLEKQLAQISLQGDKLKSELQGMTKSYSELQVTHKKETEDRKDGTKIASAQEKELVEVVMKQMKLVNNLKRQILHLKAGIAQHFTEKEVMKASENTF